MTTLTVSQAVEKYTAARRFKAPRTLEHMRPILGRFAEKFGDRPVGELDAAAVNDWLYELQQTRGLSARTLNGYFIRVASLLKESGGQKLPYKLAPTYDEPVVEVYTDKELASFFAQIQDEENIFYYAIFKLFLVGGLRMEELQRLEWVDIQSDGLHIRPKAVTDRQGGWRPKTRKPRTVTITPEVRSLLNKLPRTSNYVFPTSNGRPNKHLWRTCRRIAVRAGLDEKRFSIHQWRRSCATRLLQNGCDLRTVMEQLGHNNSRSTMRYLKPLAGKPLEAKLQQIFG